MGGSLLNRVEAFFKDADMYQVKCLEYRTLKRNNSGGQKAGLISV